MKCPDCSQVSITFEPILHFNVDLPRPPTTSKITWIDTRHGHAAASKNDEVVGPLSVVAAGKTAGAVAAYLSKAFRTPTENIVIAEIWQGKIFQDRVLDADDDGLDKETDTFVAYAVKAAADDSGSTGSGGRYSSSLYSSPSSDSEVVSVFIKQVRKDDDWASRRGAFSRDDFYGTPLILREEKEGLTVRKLYRRINGILRTM